MVHLKSAPSNFNHLAGLLDVFKGKLASPEDSVSPVSVAVRFTYCLQDWTSSSWPQQPPDMDSAAFNEVGVTNFSDFPFGACEDPISELHLSVTWPSLSEEMIVDNDVYSDLDPLQAPFWSVRVRMMDNPQCLLGDFLSEFTQLCRRPESTDQLLGKDILEDGESEADISQALDRLTHPGGYKLPSLTNVVSHASSKLKLQPGEAPIAESVLNEILQFLFPDAQTDTGKKSASHEDGDDQDEDDVSEKQDSEPSEKLPDGEEKKTSISPQEKSKEFSKQFKSAPPDSLTLKLAVCMCIINNTHGGLRGVAHLWQEFVLEMRYRWENKYIIPGLELGSPNLGTCLLHQKLQMLNCCIEKRIKREEQSGTSLAISRSTNSLLPGQGADITDRDRTDSTSSFSDINKDVTSKQTIGSQSAELSKTRSGSARDATDSSDDEEFFECEEESSQVQEIKQSDSGRTSPVQNEALEEGDQSDLSKPEGGSLLNQSNIKKLGVPSSASAPSLSSLTPEGRLSRCGDLRLLEADEDLYIPVTQEPAPMTEDMLEEHAQVLAKLGTSPEGSNLRARMQSASLMSDMESFKAANPGCVLGDFVRWYSPRDWIEKEGQEAGSTPSQGELSQRMQIPGNMWVEVWNGAKPTPARRQKRLFDDTKEAEKVLHWLATMKPCEVAVRLLPMVLQAALSKIVEQEESALPAIQKLVDVIVNKAAKATRAPEPDIKKYEELERLISHVEMLIVRAQSLKHKFQQESPNKKVEKDLDAFATSLFDNTEVPVVGGSRGPVGQIIHRLFDAAQKASSLLPEEDEPQATSTGKPDFPPPAAKEYLLRTTVARPAPWSRPSPQRMFCVLLKDDFRLAGAFSSDTTFQ